MVVCINGKFVDKENAKISVFDNGLLRGDGVFDTIAAVNKKIFWPEEHIDRLLDGCKKTYIHIPWSKQELLSLTEETFKRNKQENSIIRIIITRGEGDVLIYGTKNLKPNLIIFSLEFKSPDRKAYEKGLRLKTASHQRFYPAAKSLNFLPSVLANLDAKKVEYDDGLFVDPSGAVTEGTTFNIFVVKDATLKTPKENILLGVTRGKIIELAKQLGHTVLETSLPLQEALAADEIFATGTVKKILPVTKIDTVRIKNGEVGQITKQLMNKFTQLYY